MFIGTRRRITALQTSGVGNFGCWKFSGVGNFNGIANIGCWKFVGNSWKFSGVGNSSKTVTEMRDSQ
ncbi:MAG: hypothetical protein UW94_C0005G0166 [Parcubacteria group bacterium GW2011_GWA2_45_14]|nr:MAG: hypothetical protein UW94_C0005G0166 [Parcubacteria group bacterium GW2011_GWA2_45_14]